MSFRCFCDLERGMEVAKVVNSAAFGLIWDGAEVWRRHASKCQRCLPPTLIMLFRCRPPIALLLVYPASISMQYDTNAFTTHPNAMANDAPQHDEFRSGQPQVRLDLAAANATMDPEVCRCSGSLRS